MNLPDNLEKLVVMYRTRKTEHELNHVALSGNLPPGEDPQDIAKRNRELVIEMEKIARKIATLRNEG